MTKALEITQEDLALILDALGDAAFYRDTRSRVLKSATQKARREPVDRSDVDDHQARARAYEALALKLRSNRI